MKSIGCLGLFFYALIIVALGYIGALCVNYDLSVLLHHTIPMFWAFIISLFLGWLGIVLAVILKILVTFKAIPAAMILF